MSTPTTTTDAPDETTTPSTSVAPYGVDTSGPGFFSTWFDGALFALTLITVTAHLYVIGVAIRCSPKEMRDYRPFICMSSSVDLLFAVCVGLGLAPRIMLPYCPNAEIRGFFSLLGDYGGNIGFATCVFLAVFFLCFELYSLLYRFSLVQRRFPGLSNCLSDRWGWLSAFGICTVVAGTYAVGFYMVMYSPRAAKSIAEMDGPNRCSPAKFAWYRHNTSLIIGVDFVGVLSLTILPVAILVGISIIVIGTILFSVFIIRLLRANAYAFSAKTYVLQLQLIALLMAQILSPIIFVIFPIAYVVITIFNMGLIYLTGANVGVLLFSVYALNNALMTITFISPYRRFTAHLFTGRWRKVWARAGPHDHSTTAPQPQHTRNRPQQHLDVRLRRNTVRPTSYHLPQPQMARSRRSMQIALEIGNSGVEEVQRGGGNTRQPQQQTSSGAGALMVPLNVSGNNIYRSTRSVSQAHVITITTS